MIELSESGLGAAKHTNASQVASLKPSLLGSLMTLVLATMRSGKSCHLTSLFICVTAVQACIKLGVKTTNAPPGIKLLGRLMEDRNMMMVLELPIDPGSTA